MSCLDTQDSDQYVLDLYDFYAYMAFLLSCMVLFTAIYSCKHNYKGMGEY